MNEKYEKLGYCIVLFILLCILAKFFHTYLQPFFITLILFFFTKPIYNLFSNIKGLTKQLKGVFSIIVVNFLFFICIFKIGHLLIKNLEIIKKGFVYIFNIYENLSMQLLGKFNLHSFVTKIIDGGNSIFSKEVIREGAINTTEFLFSYFLANIIVYFLLVDEEKILKVLGKAFNSNVIKQIHLKSLELNKIIAIEIKLMIICTGITILGFFILGIKYAIHLGIICGLFDILPYIGTIFIFIPLILYRIVLKDYIRVIGLVALYLLTLIVRQILETNFVSKSFEVHPLVILIFMYIFIKITGVIGVILAPIYVISAKEILQI